MAARMNKPHLRPSALEKLHRPPVKSPCLFLGEGPGDKRFLGHLTRLYAPDAAISLECAEGSAKNKWANAVNQHAAGHNQIFFLFDADTACRRAEPNDACSTRKITIIKEKCAREFRDLKWDAIVARPCLEALFLGIYGLPIPASPNDCKQAFSGLCKTHIENGGDIVSAASISIEGWAILFPRDRLERASQSIPALSKLITAFKDLAPPIQP